MSTSHGALDVYIVPHHASVSSGCSDMLCGAMRCDPPSQRLPTVQRPRDAARVVELHLGDTIYNDMHTMLYNSGVRREGREGLAARFEARRWRVRASDLRSTARASAANPRGDPHDHVSIFKLAYVQGSDFQSEGLKPQKHGFRQSA